MNTILPMNRAPHRLALVLLGLGFLLFGCMLVRTNAATKLWQIPLDGRILASPAVASNGTIYIGTEKGEPSVTSRTGMFYSIAPAGTTNWVVDLRGGVGTAAIGGDGTIYVSSWLASLSPGARSRFHALQPDSTIKWMIESTGGAFHGCPAVGADGTTYIAAEFHGLLSVSPNGTINWVYSLPPYAPWYASPSPSIGPDGTIYLGWENSLFAINPNGSEKWEFKVPFEIPEPAPDQVVHRDWRVFRSWGPTVGNDGAVYINCEDGALYAVNPDGTLRWSTEAGGSFDISPSISPDGKIYVVPLGGDIHSVGLSGEGTAISVAAQLGRSSPALAADGSLYLGGRDSRFYQIRPDGSAEIIVEGLSGEFISSPTITPDGVLYACLEHGTLVALHLEHGLAGSEWPMFRGNPAHTARARQRGIAVQTALDGSVSLNLVTERDSNYAVEASADLKYWSRVWQVSVPDISHNVSVPRNRDEKGLFYRLLSLTQD